MKMFSFFLRAAMLVALLSITFSGLFGQRVVMVQNGTKQIPFYNVYNLSTEVIDNAAVANGDTIYVPGIEVQIPTIKKAVHLIGAGFGCDSTAFCGSTSTNADVEIWNTASGGSVEGIWFKQNVKFGSNATNYGVTNYTFSRVRVDNNSGSTLCLGYNVSATNLPTTTSTVSNILIKESVLDHVYGRGAANVDIFNCIIFGDIKDFDNSSLVNGLNIKNSVLIGGAIQYIDFAIFDQNVMFNSYYILTNSNFIDNIYYNYTPPSGSTSGNYFFPSTLATGYISNIIPDWTSAFSCSATYATDPSYTTTTGQPYGIYAGPYPMKPYYVPSNPHLRSVQVVSTGTTLNVSAEVSAQSH